MFVNAFKMIVSFAIVVVLMIYYKVPITWNILYFIPLMACLWLITFGMMCILCHFGVFVQDLSNVVAIVLKLIFYMTGIMFSIEHRIGANHPELALVLGVFNPMAYVIDGCRKSLIYGQRPDLYILAFWLLVGLLLSWIGIRLIYRNENSYVKVS